MSSNIAAALDRSGRILLAARGLDYAIWLKRQPGRNASWVPGWSSIGAPEGLEIHADPLLCRQPDGTLCVFAVASDKSLWCCVEQGAGFSPWFSLGGNVWTGTQLRLAMVALEDGRLGYVDEAGKFVGGNEPLVSVTEAIIASSAIPVVFPAVPLNGSTWVDGGVRRSTPIRAAFDAGATHVFAIAASAAVPAPRRNALPRTLLSDREAINYTWIRDYATANLLDVGLRAVEDLFPSGIMQSDLEPETPWESPVWVIRPTFDIHSALTIDRGLIRINHAYGWLRASDVTASVDSGGAMESTDEIVRRRYWCWELETVIRHLHLVAVLRAAAERASEGSDSTPEQTASFAGERVIANVRTLRIMKTGLADALRRRRELGFYLPPGYERWPAQWEGHSVPAEWDRGWGATALPTQPPAGPWAALRFFSFTGRGYGLPAEPPPTV